MTTNPESEAGKLRRIEHDPDGVATEFSVPFRWVEDSDVVVYLIADNAAETPTLWLLNIDYTLVANADPVDDTGGKIIATTAPVGKKLLIWAETDRNQQVKYTDGGDFPSESHEFALDKRALLEMEDARNQGRALRAPDTDINGLKEMPSRVERANQALVFDGDGQPSAGGISEKGQLLTSEYGEGLVLVANATAGRSYLGAAGAADVTTLNGKIDAIIGVGWVRDRIDETDLTPTFIPLDGRTIGKASSGADVANDGLRALFDIAKMVPNTGNTGTEDFDAGDTVQLPDMRGCTRISTGQRAGLTLRTLGDFVGSEGSDTVDGATGTGGSVASTAADSNMQPSYAVPFEVYSGVLPSLEQINLGQLGITWDPSGWAAATPYVRNAALRNGSATEGRSYIALQDHTSTADDEPGVGVNWQTYWAIMNYDGSPGGVGNWRGAWSALTPYVANDAVEHNGSSWIATANSTGSEPGVGPEWDLQAAKGDDGAPGDVSAAAVQDGRHIWLTNVGGTGNAITATASPTLTAYTAGQTARFVVAQANIAGGTQINIDGVGLSSIKDQLGRDLPGGIYQVGQVAEITYDGVNWRDMSARDTRPPKITIFTANGSWEPDPDAIYAYARAKGAGGGGGNGSSGGGGNGGGGGGQQDDWIDLRSGLAAQAVTIGLGGAGGPTGGTGGTTSLGALLTATGGQGGIAGSSVPGGAGGTATSSGSKRGVDGEPGSIAPNTAGARGGSCGDSGGGIGGAASAAAPNAVSPGAGGGGGGSGSNAGGNGANGEIYIAEYFI